MTFTDDLILVAAIHVCMLGYCIFKMIQLETSE